MSLVQLLKACSIKKIRSLTFEKVPKVRRKNVITSILQGLFNYIIPVA